VLTEIGTSLKYSRSSCNAADAQIRGALSSYFITLASKRSTDAAAAAGPGLGPFGSVMYELLEVPNAAAAGATPVPGAPELPEILAALRALSRKLAGLAKLSRPLPRASTGFIGNWGLLQACKALARLHQVDLRAHTLLRRRSKFAPAPAALARMLGAQLTPAYSAPATTAGATPVLPASVTAIAAANGSFVLSGAGAEGAAAARMTPAAVQSFTALAGALGAEGALTPYGPAPYITPTFHPWALGAEANAANVSANSKSSSASTGGQGYLPVYGKGYRVPAFVAGGGAIDLGCEDSAADRDMQWQLLCHAVAQRDTAVVYHLKNHYACVFAVREALVPASAPASCENDVYRFYAPKAPAPDRSAAEDEAPVVEDPTGWFKGGDIPADLPAPGRGAADDDEEEAEEEEALPGAAGGANGAKGPAALAPLGAGKSAALPPLRGALQPLARMSTRRAPAPVPLGADGKPLSVRERLEMRARGEKPVATSDDVSVAAATAVAAAGEENKENRAAAAAGGGGVQAQSEAVKTGAAVARTTTRRRAPPAGSRRASAPETGVVVEDADADANGAMAAAAAAGEGAAGGVYPTAGLKLVRQVLVARKGQLPRWWVDFDEIHRKIASGKIFCMVAFKIALPVSDDVLEPETAPGPAPTDLAADLAAARKQGLLPQAVDSQERADHFAYLKKHAHRWSKYRA